jgi:signal transduction histidine kinase
MADEIRIKQLLLNLLSNAVKFSNRGSTVSVGAGREPDGGLAIWVVDTGIGMTETDISTAMQPFQQVVGTLSRAHEGVGLGLSLVDGFVTLHGGRLELSSVPGAGTTAKVIFPAERVLAVAA